MITLILENIFVIILFYVIVLFTKRNAKKKNKFFDDSQYTKLVLAVACFLVISVTDVLALLITGVLHVNLSLYAIVSGLIVVLNPWFKHLTIMKYLLIIDDCIVSNKTALHSDRKKTFNNPNAIISTIEDYIDKIKDIYIEGIFSYNSIVSQLNELIDSNFKRIDFDKLNQDTIFRKLLLFEKELFKLFEYSFSKHSPINKRLKLLKKEINADNEKQNIND